MYCVILRLQCGQWQSWHPRWYDHLGVLFGAPTVALVLRSTSTISCPVPYVRWANKQHHMVILVRYTPRTSKPLFAIPFYLAWTTVKVSVIVNPIVALLLPFESHCGSANTCIGQR